MAEVADDRARRAVFRRAREQRAQNRLVLRAVDARQYGEKFRLRRAGRGRSLRQQLNG